MFARAGLLVLLAASLLVVGCGSQNPASTDGTQEAAAKKENAKPALDKLELSAEKDDKGVSESLLGMPYYPGSEPVTSNPEVAKEEGAPGVMSMRRSKEDATKVAQFYLSKLEEPKVDELPPANGFTSVILSGTRDGKSFLIVITSSADPKETVVNVSSTPKS